MPLKENFSAPVPEQQLPFSPCCSSLHSPGGACGSSSGPRSEENCPSSGLSLGSCSRVRAQSSPNCSSCPSLPPVCALSPQETPAAAGSGEQEQGAAAVGELHPSPPWQRGRGRPWCGQRQEGDGGAPQAPSRQVGGGEGPMETFWQDSCSSPSFLGAGFIPLLAPAMRCQWPVQPQSPGKQSLKLLPEETKS